VVSRQTAWLISDILSDPNARQPAFSSGSPLEISTRAAVKTGTTNDFRDNLTVGYTPYLLVGVWTGNKDGHPMRDVLGITGAAPIWHDTMEMILADGRLLSILLEGEPQSVGFPEPPGIQHAMVCDLATLTTTGDCRRTQESFAADMEPSDEGHVFDHLVVRLSSTGQSSATCAERAGVTAAGGSVYLLPPHDQELAQQVRAWGAANGVRVAPPPCPGSTYGY
jgi:membrane carboxypeptidase/penicillin-binding protein PbpC